MTETSLNEATDAIEDLYQDFTNWTVELNSPQVLGTTSAFEADCTLFDKYFYHPDHLGSSSYISDSNGNITQHMEYMPFGELLVDEHLNSYNSPFKFNEGQAYIKQPVAVFSEGARWRAGMDDETGNYYYGARYYNPKTSIWLSVDPLADDYPGWSPYNYCMLNPVILTDPTGMSTEYNPVFGSDGTYKGNTKEGYTGEPIIYDGNANFSNLNSSELQKKGGTLLSKSNISANNRDKVEEHIANKQLKDGLNTDRKITLKNSSNIHQGGLYSAEDASPNNLLILRGIDDSGNSLSDEHYEPTVENLRNLINIHETGVAGMGHAMDNLDGEKGHVIIQKSQIENKQFMNTTAKFQAYTLAQQWISSQQYGWECAYKNYQEYHQKFMKKFYELGGYDLYMKWRK